MANLTYFDEQGRYRSRVLADESLVIGRVESCDVTVVDDLVSREHARIDRDPDGRYRIRDLGSRNKTFVNGQQISETLLTDGDMVRIGQWVFEFLDDVGTGEEGDLSFLTPDRVDPPETQWVKVVQPVSLPVGRIASISMLTVEAGYPARTDEVLRAGLGRLMTLVQAERGFVALRGESKKDLRLAAQRGFGRVAGGAVMPVSQTFALSAMLQAVGGRYPAVSGKFDSKQGFAAAGLVAPVWQQGKAVGVVYVDRPGNPQAFSEQNVGEMIAAGAHLGTAMSETSDRLARNSVATSAGWLSTLRRMQLAMTVPPVSSEGFDVTVKLQAGRIRCGDFCDVIPDGGERLYLLLTDAGGHGVGGLSQGHGIRSAIRTALMMETDEKPHLARLMSAVNRTLGTRSARQLVLCSLLSLDLSEGKISYINAGCPPPLLLTGPGRLVTLDQPALVLGIDTRYEYEVTQVDLPSSFRLVCHSDGLCDLTNSAGEVWGTQAIHDLLLEQEVYAVPGEINGRLTGAADRHRAGRSFDDDALIVSVSHE